MQQPKQYYSLPCPGYVVDVGKYCLLVLYDGAFTRQRQVCLYLSVDLPAKFPNEKPSFIWQSVYHEGKERKPFFDTDTDYPYSPRWNASEMAERAK